MFIIRYRKEIIISFIVGIILFYLTPLLNYIGNILVDFFLLINEKFSNNYYEQVAKNYENKFSEWNSFILNVFFLASLSYIFYDLHRQMKDIKSDIENKISEIKDKKNDLINPNIKELSREEFLSKLDESETRMVVLKEKHFKYNSSKIFTIVLLAFTFISCFANHAIDKSVIDSNIEFKNDLIKIAPYVDNVKIKKLKSEWAMIKNVRNFNKIKKEVDSIKSRIK